MYNMFCNVLLVLMLAPAWAQVSHTGVFESCPHCRLDAMPELKRFLHESILKGEYGEQLTVRFIPGAAPNLILYGSEGNELSREEVSDQLSFDELHIWVQARGFSRTVQQQAEQTAAAPSAALNSRQTATPAVPAVPAAPAVPAPVPQVSLYDRWRMSSRSMSLSAGPVPGPAAVPSMGQAAAGGSGMKRRRRQHVPIKATKLANGTLIGPQGKVLRKLRKRRVKRKAAAGAAGGAPGLPH